jgi:D-alanyl-D-alanine carboxypeptidase
MIAINSPRLTIQPTHSNCWAIYDRLDNQLVGKMYFRKHWFNIILKPQSLHLGVASEASYYLLRTLNNPQYKAKTDVPHAQQFLLDLGFEKQGDYFAATAQSLKQPNLAAQLIEQLNFNDKEIAQPVHQTAVQLEDAEKDCFDRPTKLHPKANQAWTNMKAAAKREGIELQLVSAFRSLKYQANLIQNKLDKGQSPQDILLVNTMPGRSEHHTGCAIDITTEGYQALETEFENSHAFSWLKENAAQYGFYMTYPKDNCYGIIYEPWHWCYHHQRQ